MVVITVSLFLCKKIFFHKYLVGHPVKCCAPLLLSTALKMNEMGEYGGIKLIRCISQP